MEVETEVEMEVEIEVERESSPDHEEVSLFSVTAHPRVCLDIDLGGEQYREASHMCQSD